jgi:hypothetical protein
MRSRPEGAPSSYLRSSAIIGVHLRFQIFSVSSVVNLNFLAAAPRRRVTKIFVADGALDRGRGKANDSN